MLISDLHSIIENMHKEKLNAGFAQVINYKDKDHIYKPREHKPVVVVNPKEVEFYDGRCIKFSGRYDSDALIHHLGFMYDKDIINFKKNTYWNKGNPSEYSDILNSFVKREDKI